MEQEIQSIMAELESMDQNEEQLQDSGNSIKESLLVQDSTSLKEYFWKRVNRELLKSPNSFISSKVDDD